MADIYISCENCGHTFSVGHEKAGLNVPCPECGQAVAVPMEEPDPQEDAPSKIRVLKDRPIGAMPMKQCPKCGAETGAESVICTQCGYNWETGKALRTHSASPFTDALKKATLLLVVLLVVGLGAYTLWILYFDAEDERPVTPPPEPELVEEVIEEEVPIEEPPVEEAPPPEPPEEAPPPVEVEEEPVVDVEQMMNERRRELEADLDDRFPLYRRGEQVALEQQNGLIHRGVFVALRDDQVLLMDGEFRMRVPLEDLAMWSRLRCDREYRKQMIEDRLEREFRERNLL